MAQQLLPVALVVTAGFVSAHSWADMANGTVTFTSKAGVVALDMKYAYLVKGPDAISGQPARRIVLATTDTSAKITACKSMLSCPGGDFDSGMTIDFDVGPRMNFWLVGKGQRIQYSGGAKPETFALTADTPQRLAGKWQLDERTYDGPLIDVEFDATVSKEIPALK